MIFTVVSSSRSIEPSVLQSWFRGQLAGVRYRVCPCDSLSRRNRAHLRVSLPDREARAALQSGFATSWRQVASITAPLIAIYSRHGFPVASSLVDSTGRMQHGCARIWSRMIL
jgi:hypothetical protein